MKLCNGPIEIMAKEISGLKREVKRAKLFEIQRHVRRIRQLANKKGTEAQLKKNQRKVERFKKELEFLKDTEVTEIVQRITSKEGGEDEHRVDHEIKVSDDNIDLKNRALNRIIQSTKLQNFLEKISAGEDDSAQTEHRSSNTDAAPKNKQRKKTKQKARATKSFTSAKPQPKEEDEDNTDSDAEVPKQQKARKQKAAMNKSLASGKDPELEEFEDDNVYFPSSDFSESDVGEDTDNISSLELKAKGLESCFVQAMSGRKKDTLNAKSKQGKEKGKAVSDKGKKNRKGQRARQQMWEKVHGKSAKHLHKKKTELSSKEGKEPRKQKNVKTQHSLKRKGHDERLHPSWEATKRRRLQETQKVEFKGQKIRFDDSE